MSHLQFQILALSVLNADSVQVCCEKLLRNPTGILLGTLHLDADAALQTYSKTEQNLDCSL